MSSLVSSLDHTTDLGLLSVSEEAHGVLSVNKPDGWTSHDVVKRIRSQFGLSKVGHAGTLDPHATGVLPILIGKGTKIAQYLLDWDKEYLAVLHLGQRTDTQDAWGAVLETCSVESLTDEQVQSALLSFQGTIEQVPPMYSAVKVGGQPLYKKARKGESIHREPKRVSIHHLTIERMELPEVVFRVECSKGTYVRTLCSDVGDCLGVGGYLKALQRTRVGPLHLDHAIPPQALHPGTAFATLQEAFWDLDRVLQSFPVVQVMGDDVRRVCHGNAIPWNRVKPLTPNDCSTELARPLRVKSGKGELLALGKGPFIQGPSGDPVLRMETVLV